MRLICFILVSLSILGNYGRLYDYFLSHWEKQAQEAAEKERRTISYHEAGHAIVSWFLENTDILVKVSILPKGKDLGYVEYRPKPNPRYSQEELFDKICAALAGSLSEEIFFQEQSTGSRDDMKKATVMAYTQVIYARMAEALDRMSVNPNALEDASEYPLDEMQEEIDKLMAKAYTRTRMILKNHRSDVIRVAERLYRDEEIHYDDLIELLGPRPFESDPTFGEKCQQNDVYNLPPGYYPGEFN